jgi:hypothetical protein
LRAVNAAVADDQFSYDNITTRLRGNWDLILDCISKQAQVLRASAAPVNWPQRSKRVRIQYAARALYGEHIEVMLSNASLLPWEAIENVDERRWNTILSIYSIPPCQLVVFTDSE